MSTPPASPLRDKFQRFRGGFRFIWKMLWAVVGPSRSGPPPGPFPPGESAPGATVPPDWPLLGDWRDGPQDAKTIAILEKAAKITGDRAWTDAAANAANGGKPGAIVTRLPDGRVRIEMPSTPAWVTQVTEVAVIVDNPAPALSFVMKNFTADGSGHPFSGHPVRISMVMEPDDPDTLDVTTEDDMLGTQRSKLIRA